MPTQRVVLQSVITNDQIHRFVFEQGLASSWTIPGDRHWRAGALRDEHRLVANRCGVSCSRDRHRPRESSTIAA
jgi:hypothetical protein